jgi:hypothetical protein
MSKFVNWLADKLEYRWSGVGKQWPMAGGC